MSLTYRFPPPPPEERNKIVDNVIQKSKNSVINDIHVPNITNPLICISKEDFKKKLKAAFDIGYNSECYDINLASILELVD